MKRLPIAIAALAAILMLTGCQTQSMDRPIAMIANPVHPSSMEQIQTLDGISLILPKASENASWSRIYHDKQPVVAQVVFQLDGIRYCYRATKSQTLQDISGMYYAWTTDTVLDDVRYLVNDNGQGVALWLLDGVCYSLSMEERASLESLASMVGKFR